MVPGVLRFAADALTAGRLLAGPVFSWCVWQAAQGVMAAGFAAAVLFAFAAWSDIADGRWARKALQPSSYGRWLDHGADIAFLCCGFATYTALGVTPWWVLASIVFAFSAYIVRTSQHGALEQLDPLANRIGHWGGICNYVLLGVLVANSSLSLHCLPDRALHTLFVLVPLYSTAPMWICWLNRGFRPRPVQH